MEILYSLIKSYKGGPINDSVIYSNLPSSNQ